MADQQQSRYAELSTSLMMGLSSLKSQLDAGVKAGNPLEESKNKFDEEIEHTIKTFSHAREKLVQVTRAQKEFTPLLCKMRAQLAEGLPE